MNKKIKELDKLESILYGIQKITLGYTTEDVLTDIAAINALENKLKTEYEQVNNKKYNENGIFKSKKRKEIIKEIKTVLKEVKTTLETEDVWDYNEKINYIEDYVSNKISKFKECY